MTLDPQAGTLYALREAGIVTAAQYRRALAHPMFNELAGYSEPADYLVWLVCRNIMSEEQLQRAADHVAATFTGDELERHKATVATALLKVKALQDSLNREKFDTLVAEALITPAERDEALRHVSPDHLLASPAAALAWMALSDLISGERLSAAAVGSASGGANQAAILTEASDIHAKARADVKSAVLDTIFPGPRWLWIAAPVLVVGYVIWNMVRPASVPACTDSSVSRTINGMLLGASIKARVANPLQAMGQPPLTPTVHDIKEVGLATETGFRGCLAKLSIGEDEVPYAFTLSPAKGDKDGYIVTGAEPAIVQARYGHLDAKGAFANKAEPIGRVEVERAFRSGADSLTKGRTSYGRERDRDSADTGIAPERAREIAEVEPLEPCREIKAGTVYSCRLLVERNDPLLDAIGAGSGTLIDSAFTFERDGTTGPWRVSANFADEYTRAMAAARLKAIGRQ